MPEPNQSSYLPARKVLENVPKVNFYEGDTRCPEDISFPSVMRALMEYFNEEDFGCRTCRSIQPNCRVPCSYAFFLGVSGAASFLNWKPGWEGDNGEIMYMSDDPAAPFERSFNATGHTYHIHSEESDQALFRQVIVESIQNNRPVLAFGPISPPEAGLITGYDESGDVLIRWNFFQGIPDFNNGVEFEPTGQLRKKDWFNYPPGFTFITINEKKERPGLKETYRQALEWMANVANTSVTFGGRFNGLAAYDAWADQLLRDDDFPKDNAILFQSYS
jgi:hypothetical protein